MKFAIPSFDRPEVFKKMTLSYLLSENIEPDDIYVFLKNEEQLALYKRNIDENLHWIVCNNTDLKAKRQFICDYFEQDEYIVSIDDDIKRIKMMNPRPLIQLITELFTALEEAKLNLWGVYPVNNLFFCKDRVKIGKQLIIAGFCGFINRKDFRYSESAGCKEDIWLSCYRSEKDGATLRYEGCCCDTVLYTKGGLFGSRTFEKEEATCKAIVAEYPHLVKYSIKKDGHPYCVWLKQTTFIQPLRLLDECR